MGPSFAYASYISDDPAGSARVLGRLGIPAIWEGMHPFFGVPGHSLRNARRRHHGARASRPG